MTPDQELDTIHAAFLAGYDHGYARGRQDASEDLARGWLHTEAVKWTRQAMATAAAKGPKWVEAIREQAQEVT